MIIHTQYTYTYMYVYTSLDRIERRPAFLRVMYVYIVCTYLFTFFQIRFHAGRMIV